MLLKIIILWFDENTIFNGISAHSRWIFKAMFLDTSAYECLFGWENDFLCFDKMGSISYMQNTNTFESWRCYANNKSYWNIDREYIKLLNGNKII